MTRPQPIHADKMELNEYPARAPFRLWLEDSTTLIAFLTDPSSGKAMVHRPTWAQIGSSALGSEQEVSATLGTRPIDQDTDPRPNVVEAGDLTDEDAIEWGSIVFGNELGIRLEEGQNTGRTLWSGQAVIGLEPGRAI